MVRYGAPCHTSKFAYHIRGDGAGRFAWNVTDPEGNVVERSASGFTSPSSARSAVVKLQAQGLYTGANIKVEIADCELT
jgi:hypothetical protein